MRIFDAEEIIDAIGGLPGAISDTIDTETEKCLGVIASNFLTELKSTRSLREKKKLTEDFIKTGICCGMLVSNRRFSLDMMMYRDNTPGREC